MNETPQEGLHTLVDTLLLAVGLGVISSTALEEHPSQSEELLPQFTSEDPVTIGDDGQGQAMEL